MEANRTTICFDLCKYKKCETDPTLYRLYYSGLLDAFTDYPHIFTNVFKDDEKQLCLLFVHHEFSKRLPDKSSNFTAQLEAIVSALRYIQNTSNNNNFVILLLSKWDHPTVQTIMSFQIPYC